MDDPTQQASVDVNEAALVAKVTTAPERRQLPSGDDVVHFGVVARRPDGGADALPVQVGPAPPAGGRPSGTQVGRRLLADVERLQVGQRVAVTGRLQRRWWVAGGARRSRIEVLATTAEPVPDPGHADADGGR